MQHVIASMYVAPQLMTQAQLSWSSNANHGVNQDLALYSRAMHAIFGQIRGVYVSRCEV